MQSTMASQVAAAAELESGHSSSVSAVQKHADHVLKEEYLVCYCFGFVASFSPFSSTWYCCSLGSGSLYYIIVHFAQIW